MAVELTTEESDLLVAGLGILGGRVNRGAGRGARRAARWMRADIFETTVELRPPLPTATDLVARTLDALGTRTTELQAMIGSGVMALNPAVVTVTLSEDGGRVIATVRGVAKEGLIRQRAGEKAARRVAEQLTGSFVVRGWDGHPRAMEWTDDLSLRLAHGTSVRALVEYLRAADEEGTRRRDVLAVLTERFALPFDDARLAMDRVGGGIVRAASGNPANEPDAVKDPLAWTSYRLELGLPVGDDAPGLLPEQQASAQALLERARRGQPTHGTEDVAVALEVARVAVASQEPDRTRFHLLLEAATSLSVAAEACIARLGQQPCAAEGSQEWVDGVALAAAARQVTAKFAVQPDPELEERGLALVGRIVTRLLGQCHAFVGRAMIDSARCVQRNGDPGRAATRAEAVLADFAVLLDRFEVDAPFDEHIIALEYLLAAVELITEVRGNSTELDALRNRTKHVLDRSLTD
ncbi:hypothetical protein Raf01_77780 [Rugosimonospora africana]|uniref:Uncharacterized protein n=2 Tax=Rugosimonospora africana TaxID=556532 RepID=A0A8J3QZS7_9ACTN|nr:hypothetical protein Raf01_77780 [Rugosimonospora africana]